jgi:DNA replication licensing factor MCM2
LANFVVESHGRAAALGNGTSTEEEQAIPVQEGEIPQELLRKYILYAREKCRPKLYQIDQDKVARLFADMRRESLATGAYPITVCSRSHPLS